MKPASPRAVRKKLLLLQGTLHRLEILDAKTALRSGVTNSFVGQRLPGVISFLVEHKASALLTSLLPLVFGAGSVSRLVRRGSLAVGIGAALLGLLKRRKRGDTAMDAAAMDADDSTEEITSAPASDSAAVATDEKNPDKSRD